MAISKRPFIYATFILSCAAIALNVTSFATQEWVNSVLKPSSNILLDNSLSYGLFSGSMIYHIFQRPSTPAIYITCQYSDNVCVWSCTADADVREGELKQLLYNGTASQPLCSVSARHYRSRAPLSDNRANSVRAGTPDPRFINAALRVCTILFLSLALLFAVVAAVLAVANSAMNPTQSILAIFGLFIWNGCAAACDLMVLCLWGGQFSATLMKNVGYIDVVTGDYVSNGLANLGYSYWLVLGSMLLHCCNLAVLGGRKVLIDREPADTTVPVEESNDGIIFLY